MIAKGFTPKRRGTNEWLEGQFNGYSVRVNIVTNNNKVCRIMVSDAYDISESDIRIRFNNLCQQFQNNPKYIATDDYTIPADEDISYNISVRDKRYQASYYQFDLEKVKEKLLEKYSEEEIATPNEDVKNAILETIENQSAHKTVWFMIADYYGKYYIRTN